MIIIYINVLIVILANIFILFMINVGKFHCFQIFIIGDLYPVY